LKISESIGLHDNELIKKITPLVEKPKPENTGDHIEDSSNKICNRITVLGHTCTWLYKNNLDWDKKLRDIES
jgi:hypothetical protein